MTYTLTITLTGPGGLNVTRSVEYPSLKDMVRDAVSPLSQLVVNLSKQPPPLVCHVCGKFIEEDFLMLDRDDNPCHCDCADPATPPQPTPPPPQ